MKKVRFGIVGVGVIGGMQADLMKKIEEVELTALADINPGVAKAMGERHGVRYFTSHQDLIDSGMVDAVYVATPHYFHPPIGIYALRRGLHLLSEKPLAVTVGAADELIRAAKKSGRAFGVMFQQRTEPCYRAARAMIEAGRLGRLYRTLMVTAWFRSQAYYNSGGWRATWAGEGGGILINQSPHTLDLFTLLAGRPTVVQGAVRTLHHRIEVEDEAAAMLEYQSGASGYLYASTFECPTQDRIELFGEKGKMVLEGGRLRFWPVPSPGTVQGIIDHDKNFWGPQCAEEEIKLAPADSGHAAITRNFARHILTGEKLIAPGQDGINSLELANAILLSGMKKKPVKLPLNRREVEALLAKLRRQGGRRRKNK